MFVVEELKDTVRVPPSALNRKIAEVISEELNKKYSNKVIHNLGLCICLFDILKLEKSFILPGDGAAFTNVHFRFALFRPFNDEIIIGKIKNCSMEGVHITLGFFDDIIIPPQELPNPSIFDEKDQRWVWKYSDDSNEQHKDFYLDPNEPIRFRVVNQKFTDTTPTGPQIQDCALATPDGEIKCPYRIIGSISEPGLGIPAWWT